GIHFSNVGRSTIGGEELVTVCTAPLRHQFRLPSDGAAAAGDTDRGCGELAAYLVHQSIYCSGTNIARGDVRACFGDSRRRMISAACGVVGRGEGLAGPKRMDGLVCSPAAMAHTFFSFDSIRNKITKMYYYSGKLVTFHENRDAFRLSS